MKTLALAVLLTGAASVSPQQATIALVNTSESGSPVLLSGAVTAEDEGSGVLRYSLKKDISCTNVSSKAILLAIVKIKVTRLTKIDVDVETRSQDYFFTADVLKPDATDVWRESFGPFGEPQGETELKPEEPRATAQIIFVQFVGFLQRLYADTKDTDRVITKVVNMLKIAELHRSAIPN